MTIEVAIFHAQLDVHFSADVLNLLHLHNVDDIKRQLINLSRGSPQLTSSREPPSRASTRRFNDAFNVMSFLHEVTSLVFLHTTNICGQRQDTLIGAFCATESASQYWRTKNCWLPVPLEMLPWLSCLNSVFSQSSTHSVYWDTDSLVVKVSKLVHFQPDFWTFARAVLNSLSFLT